MSSYRLYAFMSFMLVIAILISDAKHVRSDESLEDMQEDQQNRKPVKHYCGSDLSDTLEKVCNSSYNGRFKKSTEEADTDDYPTGYDPYESIEDARKMLRFRRSPRGVHNECCKKPCTQDELLTYCSRY